MGAILNTLPLSETDNLENISPNRADWLTWHADATGLAVVEVERLWNRFKQITGSNDRTKIYPDDKAVLDEFSNDLFVKNFLKHFPRSKTDDDSIPFGYFIIVMQWLDGADIEKKLAAVFFYINNGEPITVGMIGKLLKFVYPETKNDEINTLAVQFMRQLGSTEKRQLNQQQFVTGVLKFIPRDELEELLHFDIIPSPLLDEINKLPSLQPSLQSSSINMRNTDDYGSEDLISNDQLRQIASQASRKNWLKLAITLGFLEYDIEAYKIRNHNDITATMYELLQVWREQEGSLATNNRLKLCLKQSGLDELMSILN